MLSRKMHQHTTEVAFQNKSWTLYTELQKEEPMVQSLKSVTVKIKKFQKKEMKEAFCVKILKREKILWGYASSAFEEDVSDT